MAARGAKTLYARISSTLDQNVKNETILIDGAPEPAPLPGETTSSKRHFAAASGRPLADSIREPFAELLSPLAHRLIGHANAAGRQHLLDHSKAQGKPEI